jgi:hypothetical protein
MTVSSQLTFTLVFFTILAVVVLVWTTSIACTFGQIFIRFAFIPCSFWWLLVNLKLILYLLSHTTNTLTNYVSVRSSITMSSLPAISLEHHDERHT